MCNLKEKGDSSDDVCANVFVHKDDDIPNSQRVRVELIKVSEDYFNQEKNLNLPSKVRSDAHFRPVNKAVDGKKVAGKGKKLVGRVNKGTGGGKKPIGRGKRAKQNFLNVSASFSVSPSLLENDIEDEYVSE